MPAVRERLLIDAEPATVFDLITRVEAFVQYSDVVKEIRPLGADTYHWAVDVSGVPLEWDAMITERVRPARFAWRSVKGFPNAGSYTLCAVAQGTEVEFRMEYHLPSHLLERFLEPFTGTIIHRLEREILDAVKACCEGRRVAEPRV